MWKTNWVFQIAKQQNISTACRKPISNTLFPYIVKKAKIVYMLMSKLEYIFAITNNHTGKEITLSRFKFK